MIFLCFALKLEADPFIDLFNLKKVHGADKVRVYKNEDVIAVITGTGIINAAEGLSYLFSRYYKDKNDVFINIGIAGGSKKDKLGDIFIINKIVGINNDEYFLDINTHPFKEGVLKTILRKDINSHYNQDELLDLEGEAYYRVAQKYFFQNNIHIIKIVSDYNQDRKLNVEFVKNLIENNLELIIKYINKLRLSNEDLKPINFSEKEGKLINRISKNYMLSKYLELDFRKKVLDYKIRGNNIIELLNFFSDVEVYNKKDRRKKYNELSEKLEVFKD
ncbi:MAG: hypothetical protein ACOCUI_00850 [bacterium]